MSAIANLPIAQAVASNVEVSVEDAIVSTVSMEDLIATIKILDATDLAKVATLALKQLEKIAKTTTKANQKTIKSNAKTATKRKGGDGSQLSKSRAWVKFVLEHAQQNGWESYDVNHRVTDKLTGKNTVEVISQVGSELVNGVHVFHGSYQLLSDDLVKAEQSLEESKELDDSKAITKAKAHVTKAKNNLKKYPNGRTMIHKDAMSLSHYYWSTTTKTGTNEALYNEFLDQYVDQPSEKIEEENDEEKEDDKPAVVRLTLAEKEAQKKAEKEAKEAEKQAKKAKEEAEKQAKKAEKEAEKAQKTGKKSVVQVDNVDIPASAIKKVEKPKKEEEKAEKPKKEEKKPVKKQAKKAKEETWSCEDDGEFHNWEFKGTTYLRNFQNHVFELPEEDGTPGAWVGIWNNETESFDSVDEMPDCY